MADVIDDPYARRKYGVINARSEAAAPSRRYSPVSGLPQPGDAPTAVRTRAVNLAGATAQTLRYAPDEVLESTQPNRRVALRLGFGAAAVAAGGYAVFGSKNDISGRPTLSLGARNVGDRAQYEQGSLLASLNAHTFNHAVVQPGERHKQGMLQWVSGRDHRARDVFYKAWAESGKALDGRLTGVPLQLAQLAYAARATLHTGAGGKAFVERLHLTFDDAAVVVPAQADKAAVTLLAELSPTGTLHQDATPAQQATADGLRYADALEQSAADAARAQGRAMDATHAAKPDKYTDAKIILQDLRLLIDHPAAVCNNLKPQQTIGSVFGMTDRAAFAGFAAALDTESSYNVNAQAATSTAGGPAQFLDRTLDGVLQQALERRHNPLQLDAAALGITQKSYDKYNLDRIKKHSLRGIAFMLSDSATNRRVVDNKLSDDALPKVDGRPPTKQALGQQAAARAKWNELKQQPASIKLVHFLGPAATARVVKLLVELEAAGNTRAAGLAMSHRLAAETQDGGFGNVIDRNYWVFKKAEPALDARGRQLLTPEGKPKKKWVELLPFHEAIGAMIATNNNEAAAKAVLYDRDAWTGKTVRTDFVQTRRRVAASRYVPGEPTTYRTLGKPPAVKASVRTKAKPAHSLAKTNVKVAKQTFAKVPARPVKPAAKSAAKPMAKHLKPRH